ncbi:MAG: LamG domain-containing protein [Pelagibacteraceae bacterium]
MAEELEQSSDNFEQQNSDDFADNYLTFNNYTITLLQNQLPFSGSAPHSLSEFRNSGFNGSTSSPSPMTGSISMSSMQLKKAAHPYLDNRQDSDNTMQPDPLAGIFQSDSNTGPDIQYRYVSNNNTQGVYLSIMGQYMDFTAGTESYAIATNASTSVTNYSFSMECWIRPDNFTSGNFNSQAVMYRGGNGLRGDIATLNTGKVRFRWTGADSGLQSSTTLSAGTWYHVVGIYHVYNYVSSGNSANSGIAAIFINGSLNSSTTLSGSRVSNSASGSTSLMSFGFYNANNSTSLSSINHPLYKFFYDGRIGHVRFYDGALPPSKVLQNYNATKGTYGYGSNSGSVYV